MNIKDAFELLIEILYRPGTKLVEYPAHLNSVICMWILTILGCHQNAPGIYTLFADIRSVVVSVSQYETNIFWKLSYESG